MKDIEALLPRVLRHAPACPEVLALSYLRDAAKEFCRRTKLWRLSDSIELPAEGEDILCAPQGSFILKIVAARIEGASLTPVTTSWLDLDRPGWRDDEAGSGARYVTQTAPDTIRVVPIQEGTLLFELVLSPTDAADQLPDFMVDQHAEVIANGAAGKMLKTPSDFANPQLGEDFEQQFKGELDRLSISARKGQQNAPLRTRGSYF
jgi:hypothetical protein